MTEARKQDLYVRRLRGAGAAVPALALIALAVVGAAPAFADHHAQGKPDHPGGPDPDRMAEVLELTDEQRVEVDEIMNEARRQREAAMTELGSGATREERMDRMRADMAGAAAVLATMLAVGQLDLPLHVVGLVPATENMPGSRAFKPGDVLTAMNGKTIEIISTDAEGRLILADALAYAARFKPKAVVDLATLTGACVVALGRGRAAGVFSTDDDLVARLQAASQTSGERIRHMPLFDDYRDSLESLTADMTNSGGRFGGVGTSAIFLKQFAEGYPWAHLDIAPMSFEEQGGSPKRPAYLQKGATGFGVRTLCEILRNWGRVKVD